METKHTKGKWEIVEKDEQTIYLCMNESEAESAKRTYGWYGLHKICLYGDGLNQHALSKKDKKEGLANAKLIAAAPELLEAAIELVYQLTGEQESEDELEKALGITLAMRVQQCKSAIKKATS